ncbi:trigger factor, partial [Brachyspira catarrhinii]
FAMKYLNYRFYLLINSKNSIGVKKDDKKLITTYIDGREATLIMEILKVEKPDMKDDSKEEDRNKVKESLKEHLIKRAEERANYNLVNKTLFDKLLETVNMEIPKGYYEEELKRALDDFEKSIANNGMNKTEFLISVAKTEDAI